MKPENKRAVIRAEVRALWAMGWLPTIRELMTGSWRENVKTLPPGVSARRHHVTRATVWSALDDLRKAGELPPSGGSGVHRRRDWTLCRVSEAMRTLARRGEREPTVTAIMTVAKITDRPAVRRARAICLEWRRRCELARHVDPPSRSGM